jgi:hypothetical protein
LFNVVGKAKQCQREAATMRFNAHHRGLGRMASCAHPGATTSKAATHIYARSEAAARHEDQPPTHRIGVDDGAPRGSSMPLGEKNMDAASSTSPTADREAFPAAFEGAS